MKNKFKMTFTGLTLLVLMFCVPEVSAQGIYIDLGKTETGHFIKLVGNKAGADGEIKSTRVDSQYCVENVKSSMFFQLDQNFFYKLLAGKFIIINVEYFDEPGVEIKLVYDAIDEANKECGRIIKTTGTNQWKSYCFYLDDCYFGHRQANQADFRIAAASGKMHINALSVVPIDYYFDFGSIDKSLGMNRTLKSERDSNVTVDGEEAIQTTAPDNYLYMTVDDSLIYGGNHPYLFVSIQYYDNNAAQTLRLQYDSRGTNTSAFYKSTPYVSGKGWNCWRTVTFEINDAWFQNRQNGGADLRFQFKLAGTPINRIMVGLLDREVPPPPPNVPVLSALKTIDAPVIDGDLKDWSWQLSGSKLEYATDANGRRTDEFFRTWLFDPRNVPIAEAGEPNVTDPGKAGLWDYNDLSGEVKFFWDEDNLYISGAVKDNVVSVKGDGWEGKDGIGLYVDVSHTIVNGKPLAIKDDMTYQKGENFIFLPASDSDPGLWKHETSQSGEALPSTIKRAVKATKEGYILEASIPLSLIKDDFTLNPGITGDPDNFNALFGYVVNDNDGIGTTSGRLAFGAPNDDDESWGTLSLDPCPLIDNGIIIDFGLKNFEQYIRQVEKGGDGAVSVVEKGGRNCVVLSNGYLYMTVDDAVINNGNHPHLFLSVEYFDELSTGKFRVQYDGKNSDYQNSEWVSLTGTGKWKTAIFEINDANFNNRENGGADFRINSDEKNLILNQVRVGLADYWINRGDSTSYKITSSDYQADGQVQTITVGGKKCHKNMVIETGSRYFYHAINDTVIYQGKSNGIPVGQVFLTVEYYDTTSSGGIALNYDSKTTPWGIGSGDAMIQGTSQWKLHTFYLTDAFFFNRQAGMNDFRVTGKGSGHTFIKHVMLGVTGNTTGVNNAEMIPERYALSQNYPNPFNPVTTIIYSIPKDSHVKLRIFDMMGREVSTLVNKDQDAGEYKVGFSSSSLPSGIYIYSIQAGQFRDSKKMVVLK